MYRSLVAKALGLRESEVFTVLEESGVVTVRRNGGEANDQVRELVLDAIAYTPEGQARVRKDSLVYCAGCQIRVQI